MPDFLISPCLQPNGNCHLPGVVCKSYTKNTRFGICDDPQPSTTPAYIKLYHPDDWIATINNPAAKNIMFKAIDNCVPLIRVNGEPESRCDGLLEFEGNLIFIELKDRDSKGWLSKGRQQLTITIRAFVANHNKDDFNWQFGYVCNKQRPLAVTGINTEVQTFKDETSVILGNRGLLLKAERTITI